MYMYIYIYIYIYIRNVIYLEAGGAIAASQLPSQNRSLSALRVYLRRRTYMIIDQSVRNKRKRKLKSTNEPVSYTAVTS